MRKFLSALIVWILACAVVHGQSKTQTAGQSDAQPDSLFPTIQSLDTKLFDAYNHCDLTTLGDMVADDLEFYHDQTGLSVGKAPFLAAIKENICGKVERRIGAGEMQVYPLKGYGAVETGVHHFRHPNRPEDREGAAKFVMLWQNKDGAWKVTRVVSYDHGGADLGEAPK